MDSIDLKRKNLYLILLTAALLFGLYLASLYSFLLFHTLAEMFSLVIAFSVFLFAWNTRPYLENHYFFIGRNCFPIYRSPGSVAYHGLQGYGYF